LNKPFTSLTFGIYTKTEARCSSWLGAHGR
jgi:hypothetical protein